MPIPDFDIFANRLRKMERHIGKWARRQGISCYRIYDADIPEFPLVIDRYEDCLQVAEYSRRHPLTEEEYRIWRSGCREVMKEVLGIGNEQLFFKERKRQKGKGQYEKRENRQNERIVNENGLQFIVNLSDYLDAGLFLDHRTTRALFREEAQGKRVLNLFAYTGSFTVYAAAGNALSTTTVDLSNTYLEWAKRNLEINRLEGPQHQFIRADVLAWLFEQHGQQYDLVILDPPAFSNSKSMADVLDIQRDYADLINQTLRLMTSGGVLYFSTNFRKFKMEATKIQKAVIEDISAQTIPNDFRNRSIHQCFRITKS